MQNYWIFQYTKPVSADQLESLKAGVNTILSQWKAHGTPLDSQWTLVENQLLYISLEPDSEGASGCSIDSLRKQMSKLHTSLEIEEASAGQIFFKSNGRLESIAWNQIEDSLQTGKLHSDTLIADGSAENDQLPARIFRPLSETWMKRYLN